jgi:hypothetical protein
MKHTKKTLIILAALILSIGSANAQGVEGVFKSAKKKSVLAKNAPSLRQHLKERKAAIEVWNAVPASELKPVTLTADVVAKNRAGYRELRVREFHYIGDCGYSDGGQDAGVETQTTAAAVFASDLADSYINQAALRGIDIDSLTIEIHGQPDKEPTNRVPYNRNFLYTIYVDSPASDAELEQLAVEAERNSSVVTLIKKAVTVPVNIVYTHSSRERVIGGETLEGLREYIHGKRQAKLAAQEAAKNSPRPQQTKKTGPWATVFANGARELTISNKYHIVHDNPAYLGGTNIGLTSRENALGVLGTCLTHISEGQAALLNLDIDSLHVRVEGEWDPRAGRKGFENEPIEPQNLRVTLYVTTPEPIATIQKWIEQTENVCPMYNVFKDTQTFEHRIIRVKKSK